MAATEKFSVRRCVRPVRGRRFLDNGQTASWRSEFIATRMKFATRTNDCGKIHRAEKEPGGLSRALKNFTGVLQAYETKTRLDQQLGRLACRLQRTPHRSCQRHSRLQLQESPEHMWMCSRPFPAQARNVCREPASLPAERPCEYMLSELREVPFCRLVESSCKEPDVRRNMVLCVSRFH